MRNIARVTEGLDFQFYLYLMNLYLESLLWPVAALLDSADLEHIKEGQVSWTGQ